MNAWVGIGILAAGTFLLRAVAPLAVARLATARMAGAIHLVAPALLAALIGVSTFAAGRSLALDERAAGVAVAALAASRRLPLPVVIAAAVATTALLRAVA